MIIQYTFTEREKRPTVHNYAIYTVCYIYCICDDKEAHSCPSRDESTNLMINRIGTVDNTAWDMLC